MTQVLLGIPRYPLLIALEQQGPYSDLEWPSIHNNLPPNIKVIHSVEEVIVRGRLVYAVTTNQCSYYIMEKL